MQEAARLRRERLQQRLANGVHPAVSVTPNVDVLESKQTTVVADLHQDASEKINHEADQ